MGSHHCHLSCCRRTLESQLINVAPLSSGDRLGQLWTDGSQVFYGCGQDSIGRARPQHNGDWLVQALTSSMVDPKMVPLIQHSSQMSLESTIGPSCD